MATCTDTINHWRDLLPRCMSTVQFVRDARTVIVLARRISRHLITSSRYMHRSHCLDYMRCAVRIMYKCTVRITYIYISWLTIHHANRPTLRLKSVPSHTSEDTPGSSSPISADPAATSDTAFAVAACSISSCGDAPSSSATWQCTASTEEAAFTAAC